MSLALAQWTGHTGCLYAVGLAPAQGVSKQECAPIGASISPLGRASRGALHERRKTANVNADVRLSPVAADTKHIVCKGGARQPVGINMSGSQSMTMSQGANCLDIARKKHTNYHIFGYAVACFSSSRLVSCRSVSRQIPPPSPSHRKRLGGSGGAYVLDCLVGASPRWKWIF